MKKILLLAVVCCTMMAAQAQRVYFMYLQSDNRSPFYLKTGDKVYSSSAHGYLIVPRLADSTYNVVIGKPGLAELRFTIPVNGRDHGFLLRQTGQQLSLFNLQSMAVIEAAAGSNSGTSFIDKTDRFTTLLAKAADDTTLLKMAVFAKVEKTPEPVKEAAAKTTAPETVAVQTKEPPVGIDTVATALAIKKEERQETSGETVKTEVAQTETVQEKEAEKTVAPTEAPDETPYKRSVVTRRSESSNSEGFGLVFTDSADGVVDTIRIVIPNPKTVFRGDEGTKENEVQANPRFLDIDQAAPPARETAKEEEKPENTKRKGLFTIRNNKADKEAGITAKERELQRSDKPAASQTDATIKVEEACKNNASSGDFSRLRRSMVGKSTEADMVGEAQKAFKNRCFTTEQIKTLSSLLLTSNGRYQLFEAAYGHVSDKENFRTLQNELWDREDINRFKALLAK